MFDINSPQYSWEYQNPMGIKFPSFRGNTVIGIVYYHIMGIHKKTNSENNSIYSSHISSLIFFHSLPPPLAITTIDHRPPTTIDSCHSYRQCCQLSTTTLLSSLNFYCEPLIAAATDCRPSSIIIHHRR